MLSPGLIVYNYEKDDAFRIESNYLRLEPMKSTYVVEGKKISSNVNIDGICLSGLYTDGYRNLYASPQASNKQYITTTKFLHDKNYCSSNEVFHYLGERCSNCQSGGAQVVDEKTGVMFYSELNSNAISCWNGDHSNYGPETQEHIMVSKELAFVSDLVISRGGELAAISCDLCKFFHTDQAVTARVLVGVVDSLIEGTICQEHSNVSKSTCCHK